MDHVEKIIKKLLCEEPNKRATTLIVMMSKKEGYPTEAADIVERLMRDMPQTQ